LGNERFVGSVSWRQNEQTFDAVRYQTKLGAAFKIDYSFINRVNRVFGSKSPQGDWRSNIHLLDMNYTITSQQQLKFYTYTIDLREAPQLSNQTIGLDYLQSGSLGNFSYQFNGAVATQHDIADNSTSFNAMYQNFEAQLSYQSYSLGLGMEKLGADNGVGFSTPLATLHKYQGFADKFLNTPTNGIDDLQLKAGFTRQNWDVQVQYHWLDANRSSLAYGREFDVTAQYKFSPQYTVLLKAARYDAADYLTDTTKLWLQWLAKF
jgi:hypothetical protein